MEEDFVRNIMFSDGDLLIWAKLSLLGNRTFFRIQKDSGISMEGYCVV